AGDVVLASTLPGAAAVARWELPHEAGSSARLQMGGEEFVAVTLPLGATESGAPATLYLLRSETAALRPILRSLGFTFLLGGILAVLLVAAATVVVTRTTVRPLSRFVAFMQSGAESRALAPFDEATTGPTEIRTLTDAYNGLVDSLRKSE